MKTSKEMFIAQAEDIHHKDHHDLEIAKETEAGKEEITSDNMIDMITEDLRDNSENHLAIQKNMV